MLKLKHKEIVGNVNNKYEGIWRLSKLGVPVDRDPGKDFLGVSESLLEQIAKVLEFPVIQFGVYCFFLSESFLQLFQ